MSLISTEVSDWNVLSSLDPSFLMTVNMMAICEGVTSSGLRNDYALFVTHNGDMYAVGSSTHGCLGLGDVTETQVPVPIKGISEVTGVSTSGTYGDVLVCTREGKLYAWGRNIKEIPCKTPTLLEGLKTISVTDAVCSRGHYLALSNDGKVYEWRGVNTWSALSKTPLLHPFDAVAVAIACGASHSLALTQNGDVYFWGVNWNADGSRINQPLAKVVDLHDERIIKIACGGDHSIVLTECGQVVTWGSNGYGQLGTSNTVNSPSPIKVATDCGRFVDIATNGHATSAAITEAGVVYMWGKGENEVKVLSPRATGLKEMHQVFAKCSRSSYVWTCRTCGEVSLVIDECPGITKEVQAAFNDENASDLTLIVENKPIHVHRYVLNQRSHYFFHSMLQEFWVKENQREIVLNAYDYEVYLSYLWFLYTGVLKISTDYLLGLWDLANAYSEESLKAGCEALLKRNLSMEKVALLYSRALTKKSNECNMWKKKHTELQEEVERLKAERLSKISTDVQQPCHKPAKQQTNIHTNSSKLEENKTLKNHYQNATELQEQIQGELGQVRKVIKQEVLKGQNQKIPQQVLLNGNQEEIILNGNQEEINIPEILLQIPGQQNCKSKKTNKTSKKQHKSSNKIKNNRT